MDLWQVLLILLRRWYVVIPVLLLTAYVASQASARVDPTYNAYAAVFVYVENPAGEGNPPTVQSAQAASVALGSPEVRQRLADAGLSPEYNVRARSRNPFIDVSVEAENPEVALETVRGVVALIPAEFASRPQIYAGRSSLAGQPGGPRLAIEVLAGPAVEDAAYEGRTRVIVVIAAVGLVAAVLLALLTELLVRAVRRSRRQKRPAPGSSTVVTSTGKTYSAGSRKLSRSGADARNSS